MSILDAIMTIYPKAIDCKNGHIGKTVLTWFWEQDEDRGYLLKTPRCDYCRMPNGTDVYASSYEQDAYYRGEKPKQRQEVGSF